MHKLLIIIFLGAFSSIMAQPKYDYNKLKMENLGRGVVAVRQDSTNVFVSWRYLSKDPSNIAFNVYRNGIKINKTPISKVTDFVDKNSSINNTEYTVRPIISGKEMIESTDIYRLSANSPIGYIPIPLNRPMAQKTPAGDEYTYSANDASIGDVDGDGQYEIILKWEPSNAHDNAHDGYTGNVYFDCYRLSGEQLWRIDMGHNIRAGAHYTQFLVYDFDGDGKAEIIMKTSDGTIDGKGKVIGDANADYRFPGDANAPRNGDFPKNDPRLRAFGPQPPRNQGRILTGNEYLTIFSGLTGEALSTIDYVPARGKLEDWGDNRANRSDRYLAAVAYLDGEHPSAVMCRGYYTRTVLAAFDWDGKKLSQHWVFDSNNPGCADYAGQGDHNLRVGDVDGDGCDEIIYGSCTINNDGTGLYSTKMGHGDAVHMTQFFPNDPHLQVWNCHENKIDGSTLTDAATGKLLFQRKSNTDVGRALAADIDPTTYGVEMWTLDSDGIRSCKGDIIAPFPRTCNMAVWWDGDLSRELLDRNYILKYNPNTKKCDRIKTFTGAISNNGTKAVPSLQGDIIGDWREEVLLRSADDTELRLYVSTIPTEYRFHTFLEDPIYRISIATENVAYNVPTQPGFYFGSDLEGEFRGTILPKGIK